MKKTISLILAAVCTASALASCGTTGDRVVEGADPYKATSSVTYADEAWLKSRIGEVPDNVTVGTADSLGINMTDFESDGYLIRTTDGETVLCGKTADGLDRAVRRYAKCVRYGERVGDVTYHEGYRIERLTVAGRDISEYTVVYTHTGDSVIPSTGTTLGNGEAAAREFARLVKVASGVDLPLSDKPVDSPYISFEAVMTDEFPKTGFSYAVADGNVVFRGSGLAGGCLNGVYYFFEHECGWINLTYGDECLAESEHVDIPEGLSHKGELTFDSFRQQQCILRTSATDNFRLGNNLISSRYQGFYPAACHGIQNQHLVEGLDLVSEQPCYNDDYVYEECLENVLEIIGRQVASGAVIGETLTYFDLAQPDNAGFCTCKTCRDVLKKEASQSGSVVMFANRISEAVNEVYPGIKFLIFAYGLTKVPPKTVKPNEYIIPTFCLDGCCYVHPLDSGECTKNTWTNNNPDIRNDDYLEWLSTWQSLCTEVYVWYYDLDGMFSAYSFLDTLYEDITYMHSIGISGIFFNGYFHLFGISRLEHDMIGAMQWQPDMTREQFDEILNRKIDEYYGEGYREEVMAVSDLIRESNARMGCDTCWTGSLVSSHSVDYLYVAANYERLLADLEEMILDAPDRVSEMRGKQLTLVLLYEGVCTRYVRAVDEDDAATVAKLTAQYGLFIERMTEAGFDLSAIETDMGNKIPIPTDIAENYKTWKAIGMK